MATKKDAVMFVSTEDGDIFIGLFKLRDTYGLPLPISIGILVEQRVKFSLPHLIIDAINAGWKKDKIRAELREVLCEHVSKAERDVLMELAEAFLKYEKSNNAPAT
jgi:alanyl-tRNA synthetase